MGEYAKYKGEEIKIGTCESMYYLRYEDRGKVTAIPHSINPALEKDLFWRLPFPDEDNINPGEYDHYNRGYRLYKPIETPGTQPNSHESFADPETFENPGTIQLRDDNSGLMANVNCYHGGKLPVNSEDAKFFWNGKGWFFELAFIKNTGSGVEPVVRCKCCGNMWRYTWGDVLPYIHGEIKARLEKHI